MRADPIGTIAPPPPEPPVAAAASTPDAFAQLLSSETAPSRDATTAPGPASGGAPARDPDASAATDDAGTEAAGAGPGPRPGRMTAPAAAGSITSIVPQAVASVTLAAAAAPAVAVATAGDLQPVEVSGPAPESEAVPAPAIEGGSGIRHLTFISAPAGASAPAPVEAGPAAAAQAPSFDDSTVETSPIDPSPAGVASPVPDPSALPDAAVPVVLEPGPDAEVVGSQPPVGGTAAPASNLPPAPTDAGVSNGEAVDDVIGSRPPLAVPPTPASPAGPTGATPAAPGAPEAPASADGPVDSGFPRRSDEPASPVAPSRDDPASAAAARSGVFATDQAAAPSSPMAPRAQMAAVVQRLLDVVERLGDAPPPRQMIVEIPQLAGLRVMVEVRGTTVVLQPVGANAVGHRDFQTLAQDVAGPLGRRGFDLSDSSSRDQRRQDDGPPPAPASRPGRPGRPLRPEGLRL